MSGTKDFDTLAEDSNLAGATMLDANPDNGQSFTTDAASATLSEVQLTLSLVNPSDTTGTVSVLLYSDSNGTPSQLVATLGTIDESTLSGTPGVVSLPLSGVSLQPNTTYWIVLEDPTGDVQWSYGAPAGSGFSGQNFDAAGSVASDATDAYAMSVTTDTAGTDFDTTGETITGEAVLDGIADNGQSFVTGADSGFITDVKLELSLVNAGNDGSTFSVWLYGNGNGVPGGAYSRLAIINENTLTSTPSLVDVQLPAGYIVEPDATYWLMLQDPSGDVQWALGGTAGSGTSGQHYDEAGTTSADTGTAFIMSIETEPTGTDYDGTAEAITGESALSGSVQNGQSFVTDGNSATLTDVTVELSLINSGSASGSVTVYLYDDNGGAPGNLVGTIGSISESDISSTPTVFNLPVTPGSIAVSPSTTYWIVLEDPNGNVDWAYGAPSGVGTSSDDFLSGGTVTTDSSGSAYVMSVTTAAATVDFNSTGESTNNGEQYPVGTTDTFGESFQTDANSAVLTDVKVKLTLENAGTDSGTVSVYLYADGGGTSGPTGSGTLLGTIADDTLSNTPSLNDVPVSGVAVDPDTTYWIVVEESNSNEVGWNYGTPSGTGTGNSDFMTFGTAESDSQSHLAFVMQVTTDACYAAGTRILTDRGEIAVEALREGDKLMALRRGGFAALRWIGRRDVDFRAHPNLRGLLPVRIAANAIAPGQPHRDLLVSPDHALFIDGALISARHLLNGATIRQENVWERISYYHLELDAHDILLAEGLAAESFLDVGNRSAFQNGGFPLQLTPCFDRAAYKRETWERLACAPSLEDADAQRALQQRLLARAFELGHKTTPAHDLHILAAGRALRPDTTETGLLFALPPGAGRLVLASRSVVPSQLGVAPDGRTLGVGVRALALDGARLALDDPRLTKGWHPPEKSLRWTSGIAHLEAGDAERLELRLHSGLLYWAEEGDSRQRQAS